MTQEELEFRRRCPYDAFGDYSDVLKEIRQKEKENKTDGMKWSCPPFASPFSNIVKGY